MNSGYVWCMNSIQGSETRIDKNRADGMARDVTHLVSYIPLIDSMGRRKQRTPVAEIQTVLHVIMLHFTIICRAFVCCPANQRRRQSKQSIRPSSPRRPRHGPLSGLCQSRRFDGSTPPSQGTCGGYTDRVACSHVAFCNLSRICLLSSCESASAPTQTEHSTKLSSPTSWLA